MRTPTPLTTVERPGTLVESKTGTVAQILGTDCDQDGKAFAFKVLASGVKEPLQLKFEDIEKYGWQVTGFMRPPHRCQQCGEWLSPGSGYFANEYHCSKCDIYYNSSGQRLAPKSQWGEETGEYF